MFPWRTSSSLPLLMCSWGSFFPGYRLWWQPAVNKPDHSSVWSGLTPPLFVRQRSGLLCRGGFTPVILELIKLESPKVRTKWVSFESTLGDPTRVLPVLPVLPACSCLAAVSECKKLNVKWNLLLNQNKRLKLKWRKILATENPECEIWPSGKKKRLQPTRCTNTRSNLLFL